MVETARRFQTRNMTAGTLEADEELRAAIEGVQEKQHRTWEAFSRRTEVIPLHPEEMPALRRDGQPGSLCVYVRAVQGAVVPAELMRRYDNPQFEHRFSVTLFDTGTRRFFGNTYLSPHRAPAPGRAVARKQTIQYDFPIYLKTSVQDNRVVAVIEFIVGVRYGGVIVQETSIGWTVVRLFGNPATLRDTYDEDPAASRVLQTPIYIGTPRAIMFLSEPVEKQLEPILGCHLNWTLNTHKALSTLYHLLGEHALIGIDAKVAGVEGAGFFDDNSDMADDPFLTPDLALAYPIRLASLRVTLPRLYEQALLAFLKSNRQQTENISEEQADLTEIIGRRCRIGLHNGRTFVRTPSMVFLEPSEETENGCLVLDFAGHIPLHGLVLDPLFAIVYLFEYTIRMRFPKDRPGVDTNLPVYTEQTVLLGWSAFFPYDGSTFLQGIYGVTLNTGACHSVTGEPMFNADAVTAFEPGNLDKTVAPIHLEFNVTLPMDSQPAMVAAPALTDTAQSGLLRVRSGASVQAPMTRSRSTAMTPRSLAPRNSVAVSTGTLPRQQPEQPLSPSSRRASAHHLLARAASQQRSMKALTPPPAPTQPSAEDGEIAPSATADGDADASITYSTPTRSAAASAADLHAMSRAARAKLHSAGFPEITDAFGQAPMDMGEVTMTRQQLTAAMAAGRRGSAATGVLDLALEATDPLQANEVHLIFLAYTDLRGSAVPISRLYCTLRFYRFPPVRTEALRVTDKDSSGAEEASPGILVKADASGPGGAAAGLQLVYLVDPGKQCWSPDETRDLAGYLHAKQLLVDVWDADTLQRVGTLTVDLHALLRQQRQSVQFTDAYDVFAPRESTGQYPHDVCGRMHLRLANVGRVASTRTASDANDSGHGSSSGGIKIVRPRLLVDMHTELKDMLAAGAEAAGTGLSLEEERASRERRLDLVHAYRQRQKKPLITAMLKTSLTRRITVYPSYGVAEVIEVLVANPYTEPHTFRVVFDDPELTLLLDADEVRALKRVRGIDTPTEENMVTGDNKVYLAAGESVLLPFKFVSFQPGVLAPQDPDAAPASQGADDEETAGVQLGAPITRRTMQISIVNSERQPVCMTEVEVVPRNPVIHRTFRYAHFENEFLKDNLVIVDAAARAAHGRSTFKWLHCSSADALVQSKPGSADELYARTDGQPQCLAIKYRCGSAPAQASFLLTLYNDRYQSEVWETWLVLVMSQKRLDLNGTLGQTSRGRIVLKGSDRSRTIRCTSSVPDVLNVVEGQNQLLVAGALNEVVLAYRPLRVGKRLITINVIDVDFGRVISSWCVATTARNPSITKTFDLELPRTRVNRKKFSYSNPYPYPKTFVLSTSRPDLVQFKETRLEIAGGEAKFIGLVFQPVAQAGLVDVLVFINDNQDVNEECLCIQAHFVDPIGAPDPNGPGAVGHVTVA